MGLTDKGCCTGFHPFVVTLESDNFIDQVSRFTVTNTFMKSHKGSPMAGCDQVIDIFTDNLFSGFSFNQGKIGRVQCNQRAVASHQFDAHGRGFNNGSRKEFTALEVALSGLQTHPHSVESFREMTQLGAAPWNQLLIQYAIGHGIGTNFKLREGCQALAQHQPDAKEVQRNGQHQNYHLAFQVLP